MSVSRNGLVLLVLLSVLACMMATPVNGEAALSAQNSIMQNLNGVKEFSTTTKAIQAAGFESSYNRGGPYTLFAPVNSGFNKFTSNTLDSLLKDRQTIGNILLYHTVQGRLTLSQIMNTKELKSIDGRTLPVEIKDGYVYVGGSRLISQAINSKNGVIYAVEDLMIPPTGAGVRSIEGRTSGQVAATPGVARQQQAPPAAPPARQPGRGLGIGPIIGMLLLLGALLLGGLLIFLMPWLILRRRSRQREEQAMRQRYEEAYKARPEGPARTTYTEPSATTPGGVFTSPRVEDVAMSDKVTLDESAVNELNAIDRIRLAGIKQYIIGSYSDFKDRLDLVRDAKIDLVDIKDMNAVKRLSELYALSPFNSRALELAIERGATILTVDRRLMDIYRAAGAKTDDVKKYLSRL